MSNRRNLRESVLKAVYAYTLGSDDAAYVISTIIKPDAGDDPEDLKFAEDLFLKTIRLSGEFDQLITSRIKNWELSRIALVDKIILWMSICEFLHFEQIPTKVTINEAIEIAKEYSTAKSGKFVNGVLDAILDDLIEQDRIHKKGLGLLESTPKKTHPKS
jgi:transcription antitermination protein NusB